MSEKNDAGREPAASPPTPARTRGSGWLANAARLAGGVGAVVVASLPLTYLHAAHFGPLAWGKLFVGGALFGFFLLASPNPLARLKRSRSSGFLLMAVTSVVLVLVILGAVNFALYRNPTQIDVTREGLFTLSRQTQKILDRLETQVRVLAFYPASDPAHKGVEERLRLYADASRYFSFEMVDPQSRPDLAERYQVVNRGPRLVVTAGTREARAKDASEEEIANAIIKVAQQAAKRIYFLVGHGEADIEEATAGEGCKGFAEAIAAEGYQIETLSLLSPNAQLDVSAGVKLQGAQEPPPLEIPEQASVLVIAGARAALFEPELDAVAAYLEAGGRLLALLDPMVETGLEKLLAEYRIAVHRDLVVDPNPLNRLLGLGVAAPMVLRTENEHVITKDLVTAAVMPTTRSLAAAPGGKQRVDVQPIAMTGETAWGETRYAEGTAEQGEDDNLPPVHVAIVATRVIMAQEGDEKEGEQDHQADDHHHGAHEAAEIVATEPRRKQEARVIAVGDSDWVSNQYLPLQGNADLALNMINFLAEEQQRIGIRPKSRAATRLLLSGAQMAQVRFVAMDILPVLIVALGLGIMLMRRSR